MQWTLEQNGDGFQLKNAATGLYIGIDGEPSNSAPVIASSQGQHWEVKPDHSDPSVFRLVRSILTGPT